MLFSTSKLQYLLLILILLMLALVRLPMPFDGDQALFFLGAQEFVQGGRYYDTFWDWKAPGIYAFFTLAISTFGASEIGVHLFELVWLAALAVLLFHWLKDRFTLSYVALAVPLLGVGVYYMRSVPAHATQVEVVVGLPLFLSMMCCVLYSQNKARLLSWCFLAGVLAAVVSLFKPILGLIPAAVFLTSVIYRISTSRHVSFSHLAMFAAGVIAAWTTTAMYFGLTGRLEDFLQANFIAPLQGLAHAGVAPVQRLDSLSIFLSRTFGPVAIFILLAVFDLSKNIRRTNIVFILALVWILSAALVVWLQIFAWWSYHLQLFYVPAAILATRGIDITVQWISTKYKRPVLWLCIILIVVTAPNFLRWTRHVSAWNTAFASPADESLLTTYKEQYTNYADINCKASFLNDSSARVGNIYVFGNPNYYLVSNRQQAVPIRGWALRVLPPSHWESLTQSLMNARPVYLFLGEENREYASNNSATLMDWIEQAYIKLPRPACADNSNDDWYERKRL